jgi:hypothetical protein
MKERGGVQSIERAFNILEEVASHRDGIRLASSVAKSGCTPARRSTSSRRC